MIRNLTILGGVIVLVVGGLFYWRWNSGKDDLRRAASSSTMRQIITAMNIHAQSHRGDWPASFAEFSKSTVERTDFSKLENPYTHSVPGYEYVKPSRASPPSIVLYQLRDGQRDTTLSVGYSDGRIDDYDPAVANADKPNEDHSKEDAKQPQVYSPASTGSIEGNWKVVGCKRDGRDDPSKIGQSLNFAKGQFTGTIRGNNVKPGDGAYDLLVGKIRPGVQIVATAGANNEFFAVTGVYEVAGGAMKLRITVAEKPKAIPPNDPFASEDGDGWEVLTMERAK